MSSLTLSLHVTKCTHFLRFTNLAFFQKFIVMQISFVMLIFLWFWTKFLGGQTASGGVNCGRKPANRCYVGHFANSFVNPCTYSMYTRPCFPIVEPFIFLIPQDSLPSIPRKALIFFQAWFSLRH